MRIPVTTKPIGELLSGVSVETLLRLQRQIGPVDARGRYLHWDKLRHLTPPDGCDAEQWWLGVKLARRALACELPLVDKYGRPMQFGTPDGVWRHLHWLDRFAAGAIRAPAAVMDRTERNTYLIRSLMEEAITSSQLEGASTTRDVAREMIRRDRRPKDRSERMIWNNYFAMEFIREVKGEALTPAMVMELHRIVSNGDLAADSVGVFRRADDDIHVVDNRTQAIVHTPPAAETLPERLERLCAFANQTLGHSDASEALDRPFWHPVLVAIMLHFMLAYDHPFRDGNGRTARALFYWAMVKRGYWLVEFISLSRQLLKAPAQYGRAFLYTETDDNDLTYFLIHQLEVMRAAIEDLHAFLDRRAERLRAMRELLDGNARLRNQLNFRQLSLLRHALKHPNFAYVIEGHQRSHGVSYDVARKDLLRLSDGLRLLEKARRDKRYFFIVPGDLAARLRSG